MRNNMALLNTSLFSVNTKVLVHNLNNTEHSILQLDEICYCVGYSEKMSHRAAYLFRRVTTRGGRRDS